MMTATYLAADELREDVFPLGKSMILTLQECNVRFSERRLWYSFLFSLKKFRYSSSPQGLLHQTLNQRYFPLFFVILFALCACLAHAESPTPSAPETGTGVEGTISLHTVHGGPAIQGFPDSRPLGNMTFEVKKGDLDVAAFTTDAQGHFRISLPAGDYTVSKKDWKSRVGFFGPFPVRITAGQMQKVQWKCDTGMQ